MPLGFGVRICAAWLLLAAAPAPADAQGGTTVFDGLDGEWHGEGTLMGRSARFTMHWRHREGLAVLTFANELADSSGGATPALRAVAVYRTGAAHEAVWFDSRGVRAEIRWEASDSALVAHWTAATETGRTTYRVRSAEEIEVVDEVRSGDTWRTFGVARYHRSPTDGR